MADPTMSDQSRGPDSARTECACDVSSIRAHFDDKVRRADAPASPHATTRVLVALLGDPTGRRVLEIGTGRGRFLASMLQSGASGVTGIDISPVSIEAARRQLAEAGFSGRATLREGDGAIVDLDPHDWVVLDRVICCYPEPDGLVAHSTAAAANRYAFSVPASRGLRGLVARVAFGLEYMFDRLRHRSCPAFVHDLDRIEGLLASLGFERRVHAYRGIWYIAVFERT